MGCDIHGVYQVKFPSGGWRTWGEIEDDRNYVWFSIIAGVRNYLELDPIQMDRGFPPGFHVENDEHREYRHRMMDERKLWMGDHSFGWVTLKEIEDWPGWTDELRESCAPYLAWVQFIRTKWRDRAADELRIVFGFDN